MPRPALALFLALSATTLLAQQAPQAPSLIFVHEELAKPSMIADYEKTTKEFGAMLRAANLPFYYQATACEDFHYYYVMPMKGGGDIDAMLKMFMADLPEKAGREKVADLMRRSGSTIEMSRDWIALQRNDLSYVPAKPRLEPEQMNYFRFDFYYVKPGMEDMIDQLSNEWKAASAAANIPDGFTVYQAVVGGELPLVVVQFAGKDPADLTSHMLANMQTLGDKGRALNAKTLATVRRFESRFGRARPDLGNPAPAQK